MSEQECVVWYWGCGTMDYETFGTEAEAARFAAYTYDFGEVEPVGVQFPDGRAVRIAEWPAFREARVEVREAEARREEARRAEERKPHRQIKDPFEGKTMTVDTDVPTWIGVAAG